MIKISMEAFLDDPFKDYEEGIIVEQWNPRRADDFFAVLQDPCCQVKKLDLRSNRLGADVAVKLADALPNTQITYLVLWNNNMGDEGAAALARALTRQGCILRHLDIAENRIGDEGAKAFAEAMKDANSRFAILNLWRNFIGDEGAKALAEALRNPRCPLSLVGMTSNRITTEGEECLVRAAEANQNIIVLECRKPGSERLKKATDSNYEAAKACADNLAARKEFKQGGVPQRVQELSRRMNAVIYVLETVRGIPNWLDLVRANLAYAGANRSVRLGIRGRGTPTTIATAASASAASASAASASAASEAAGRV